MTVEGECDYDAWKDQVVKTIDGAMVPLGYHLDPQDNHFHSVCLFDHLRSLEMTIVPVGGNKVHKTINRKSNSTTIRSLSVDELGVILKDAIREFTEWVERR